LVKKDFIKNLVATTVGIMMRNVELRVEQEGDVYIIVIEGRIDATTTPIVEKKLAKLDDLAMRIAIDFSDVEYLSSAGMRLLLSLAKRMQSKGGIVAIYGMADDVVDIIRMAGFERILNLFGKKADALKSLK
jgi:anti-sigma B factor antagonist/stage II sporulation protein AA (anti-sigma F factor antagonist)